MTERTADVRRVVELVEGLHLDQPRVAVMGHPCPWRDDLVGVLAERIPGAVVTAYVDPPGEGADLTVWLENDAREARLQTAVAEWTSSGRRGRGEPIFPGARWVPTRPDEAEREREPEPDVDVVFVPVSGVCPPRRLRLFYDQGDHAIWDEELAHLGDLEDLLPLSDRLRRDLGTWLVACEQAGGEPRRLEGEERRLRARLAEELRPEFEVQDR